MCNFQNMLYCLTVHLIFQLGEQLIIYMFKYFLVHSFIFLDSNLYNHNTTIIGWELESKFIFDSNMQDVDRKEE